VQKKNAKKGEVLEVEQDLAHELITAGAARKNAVEELEQAEETPTTKAKSKSKK
jgi:TusA-related sulfurtransferase